MTSSTSTGRCHSFISPPPLTSDPERILEAHVVRPAAHRPADVPLDPEPADRRGQRRGIFEALAVRLPCRGSPDLGVIASTDDDRFGAQAGHLAEVARDQDAALTV